MREILEQGLPQLGLETALVPELVRFADLVLERNQVMNLTAITEPEDFAALHLLDSLELVPIAELHSQSIIDVGCGAGFPGVPVAIARPEVRMTLLDSLGKRIDFLQEACDTLGLQNVQCVHARAEEFAAEHREIYDIAVSRAVAALPVLCELCLPLVRPGGVMLAMKSSHSEVEIASAENALHALCGEITWMKDYTIPGTQIVHRVICIKKIAICPKKYPRRFTLIKKSPL